MRTLIAAALLAATAAPLYAQSAPDHVLTPAPVPNIGAGSLNPGVSRTTPPDGADRSAPFSSLPTGATAGSGQTTPSTIGTPNREGAPAPSLSK